MAAQNDTDEMVARVRGKVIAVLTEKFRAPPGKRKPGGQPWDGYPGGQRAIAEALGISQSTLNAYFIKGNRSDFGLDVLVALRAYFRRLGEPWPQTLDELLFGESSAAPIRVVRLDDALKMLGTERPSRKKRGAG